MEQVVEKLREQVDAMLQTEAGLFPVGCILKGNGRARKLVIILDGDQGVSIDQCAEVSRHLSRYMDENIELESPLTLEVSSAGLDHPLSLPRQYRKNVGRQVKSSLKDGTVLEGELLAADDERMTIAVSKDEKERLTQKKTLYYKDIDKTIVLISFK